ncbi:MAG: tetratricopeptide repeat protein [Nitrospirae bacterium]|nr:MAG: tetratricopeptide repeat protein [Nitrospirota bacterium]
MPDRTTIFKEAQKFISKGQIDRAIQLWEDYVKQNPDGNTYNTIGDLYYRSGRKDKAIEYFHKSADFFHNEGFLTRAQALYKKILNYSPNDPQAHFKIGLMNEEKGLVTDAIKYYLAAADAYAKARDREELQRISKRIVDLAPDNLSLRVKLAQYLQKEGFIEDAAKEYLEIGRTCEESGDIDQAREFYELALELYPRLRDIYPVLFDFYLSQEEYEKAESLLKKGKELHPDDIEIDFCQAELYKKTGNNDGAKEILLRILSDISPVDQKSLYVRASRLLADIYFAEEKFELSWEGYEVVLEYILEKGEYEEAANIVEGFSDQLPIEAAEKLVEIYRKIGDGDRLFDKLVRLGDIYSEKGEKQEAYNYYTEALKIRPDDPDLTGRIQTLEGELGIKEPVQEEAVEKTVEEKLTDADIFLRYGLVDEALDVLEKLKVEEPENMEVHRKLKNIYLERNDKEAAVTECLIMARLYERDGNLESKGQILKEAYDIFPEDPRLLELTKAEEGMPSQADIEPEFTGSALEGVDEESLDIETPVETTSEPQATFTEFAEDLAEADFYLRQGLNDDAMNIYNRLLKMYPGNEEILRRIREIGGTPEEEQAVEGEMDVESKTPAEGEEPVVEAGTEEDIYESVTEEIIEEGVDQDEVPQTEDVPEPSLESEVLEIFEEFKKGISDELEDEDYETHYNLGIAYKEMGLLDDAIKEFQVARNDPERKIQVLTMLGICYMEKKLYSLAIKAFTEALENMTERDESYWGLRYDLADAYERHGDLRNALNHYIDVFDWDSSFREVSKKVSDLRKKVSPSEEKPEVAQSEDNNKKPKKDRISYI